jgi:hypothetical protein
VSCFQLIPVLKLVRVFVRDNVLDSEEYILLVPLIFRMEAFPLYILIIMRAACYSRYDSTILSTVQRRGILFPTPMSQLAFWEKFWKRYWNTTTQ